MCAPVIWTNCVCHRSVIIISYQPVETLVGEEADLLPLRTRHIVTARVQVAQQQDVLLDKCNGWFCPIPRTCCLSSMNCDLFVWHVKKKEVHIGIPAVADINNHIIESIYFLHSAVWRGVLGNQDKVLHD